MKSEIEGELRKLKKRWMDRVENDMKITSVSKEILGEGRDPYRGVGQMQREIGNKNNLYVYKDQLT